MLIMRLAQKYAYRSEVLVVSSQILTQNHNNHARTANLCGMLCFCNIAFGNKPEGFITFTMKLRARQMRKMFSAFHFVTSFLWL